MHNDIVWRILKRARRGTRIVYRAITTKCSASSPALISAASKYADGRRLMVLHGDEFDAVMLAHRWLAFAGDASYHLLMGPNNWVGAGGASSPCPIGRSARPPSTR